MDIAGMDVPKSARERVAVAIGILSVERGSHASLVAALRDASPALHDLEVETVASWVGGHTLPRGDTADAIAALMGARGEAFLRVLADAAAEDPPSGEARPLESHFIEPRGFSVLGLVWLGACTDDLPQAFRFYRDVLGLHLAHQCDADHAIFRTDNGDFVALYGPKSERQRLFRTGPVAGFRVSNIMAARSEMEGKGVSFLGPVMATDNGRWRYLHYLGPDGRVYELVEESPWGGSR